MIELMKFAKKDQESLVEYVETFTHEAIFVDDLKENVVLIASLMALGTKAYAECSSWNH